MIIMFILISTLFAQGLNIKEDFYSLIYKEINTIKSNKISEDIYIYPTKESIKKEYFDFYNDSNINIYPVMGLRYSSTGFEINQETPNSIIWISPGIEFNFNQILINSINPIWMSGAFNFFKHSAYGLNKDLNMGNTIGNQENQNSYPIFRYNNNFQYGFYRDVKDNNNGIDFDETIGYTSILGNNFDISIGKFRSSLGPSIYSNLSLSSTMPSFNQFRANYNYKDKVILTFIFGDLHSNIIDSSYVYEDEIFDNKYPLINRRIYNHRIDFNIKKNFRIGLYEQIISMSDNTGSLSYINPFQFFWSEQHQNNDLDNLQIGFDFDYLYKNNRFYGGMLIDEWAPYDTFNQSSHNWFARQIGYSKVFNFVLLKQNIDGILKYEYSSAEPQVYTHKFDINIPSHHNYPIGLWSGGDSIDKRLSILFFVIKNRKEQFVIDLSLQNTRFGNPNYDEELSLLGSDNIKSRDLISIQFKKTLSYSINLYFKVGYYKTENLYSEDNFLDFSTSLLYNIKN